MVMPNQLKKKEFSKTIKGYSVPEVDEYISYILSSYQDMFNEYAELEKNIRQLFISSKRQEVKKVLFRHSCLTQKKWRTQ